MAVQTQSLKPSDNIKILNSIRNEQTLTYQQRIPEATKANVQKVLRNLQNNPMQWNEFVNGFINKIGLTIFQNSNWKNKLAEFKRGFVSGGDTIEEYIVGLVESQTYDPDREYGEKVLFGTHRPRVEVAYHKINRQEFYVVTINKTLLERAFLTPMGLHDFSLQFLESASRSDQLDEFLVTCSMFREYDNNGGFFRVNVPSVSSPTSTPADARMALRRVKEMVEILGFPSVHYNAAKMPVSTEPGDLILFCTPEWKAAVDVEALAAAFQIDKMSIEQRMITIPKEHFNMPDVEAILTTKDFFVIADTHFSVEEMRNPAALQSNHFLHHHQIISVSLFVNAVAFTTGPGDTITENVDEITGITALKALKRDDTETTVFTRGEMYQLTAMVAATPADAHSVGVRYAVSGALDSHTYVTPTGVIHVGFNEGDGPLTVTGTTVWIDNNDVPHAGFSTSADFTVTGDKPGNWAPPVAAVAAGG